MTAKEIALNGWIGVGASGLAVITPILQNINLSISIIGGLIGIAVAVVSLYRLLKHKDK